MFCNIPQIKTADRIIDHAIRKTKKINIKDKDKQYKRKKEIISKIETFTSSIVNELEGYVKGFPSLGHLPLFYQELIDIKISKDKLKQALGAVEWARKTCLKIYNDQKHLLKKNIDVKTLMDKQREIYGRLSSVVKQIDKNLVFLADAEQVIKTFPHIDNLPTIVIAGYPNVGKSSLLRCLSNAKPRVSPYPFTTKEIHIGHLERVERYSKNTYQIIDTPGLLDRPLNEKNRIEKQAIAALKHLADIIVFIMDPSETSGYTMKKQERLLSQIKELFPDTDMIIVENKKDIKQSTSPYLKISCMTNEGIDELKKKIFKIIDKEKETSIS